MRCIKLLMILMFLISLDLSAQKMPGLTQEIMDYDYLSHKYEHLDENFKIHISSEKFQSIVEQHRFIPERINEWKDSIGVVTMGEFNNWHKSRIAKLHITYSYKRIAYYLWIKEAKAKKLCRKYGVGHVYRFHEYMKSPESWDKRMKKIMLKLREQVAKASNNSDVLSMTNKMFLREAWRHSPERIIDFKKLQLERQLEQRVRNRHQNPR